MANVSALRSYRAENKISLEGLAAKFGVHKTTVMRWEDDAPPPERILEIERVTGVPRHALRPDLYAPAPSTEGRATS